jgi:hypothetical protein
MSTIITYTDPSGEKLPVPSVTSDALYRYLRHTLGDVDASKFVREAKKLGGTIRKLAEAGDHDAIRELVARINNAPAL